MVMGWASGLSPALTKRSQTAAPAVSGLLARRRRHRSGGRDGARSRYLAGQGLERVGAEERLRELGSLKITRLLRLQHVRAWRWRWRPRYVIAGRFHLASTSARTLV